MCSLHIYHPAMLSIAHTNNAAFVPGGELAIAGVRRAGLSPANGLF
jgi:hypothetical protein